jgi:hypothetical protein
MTWIVYTVIGVVVGIMFGVAYPDTAQTINDSLQPTLHSISGKIGEIGIQILKDQIIGIK